MLQILEDTKGNIGTATTKLFYLTWSTLLNLTKYFTLHPPLIIGEPFGFLPKFWHCVNNF